jgi:CheY-like chemotaxis protein
MKQPSLVIVEDEMSLALALTNFAEELGYQVLATANTELSAVETVLERQPDVVLMDIHLAGGNGLGAALAIRKKSKVPIVFCTAYASNTKIRADILKLGNTALIGKPIDEAELTDMLASAIKGDTENANYAYR